jgi:ribosomal RNA-processing protein 9
LLLMSFLLGSRDGHIRLWKTSSSHRNLEEVNRIPVTGFVNALSFSPDGRHLVAAVGQEHRLGRWWRIKEAKNSIVVIPLMLKED